MFRGALFTIAKTRKQPKCPLTEEWIKKVWYIYTMEYYSTIKTNEIIPFGATWMDLEIIILSEVSQTEKNKYHMTFLICGIQKNDTNELIYKTEIDSQTQKANLWLPKGKQGRDKLGVWDLNIHTTIYKIDNQQEPTVKHRELYAISYNNL